MYEWNEIIHIIHNFCCPVSENKVDVITACTGKHISLYTVIIHSGMDPYRWDGWLARRINMSGQHGVSFIVRFDLHRLTAATPSPQPLCYSPMHNAGSLCHPDRERFLSTKNKLDRQMHHIILYITSFFRFFSHTPCNYVISLSVGGCVCLI